MAIGADASTSTGEGVKLCVLDTGCDVDHSDFAGCTIVSRSFVQGETAQDGHGHGTHCAGTAAGTVPPALPDVPRYGPAPGTALHVGKVLNNSGSGRERDILLGMLWAIREGCAVISMSLGRPVRPGEGPSPDYERVGRRALEEGSLIVAAAGNDSARQYGHIAPVGAPANSPSIMAVAAVDQRLDIAALWAERDSGLRARALWDTLSRTALLTSPLKLLQRLARLVRKPPRGGRFGTGEHFTLRPNSFAFLLRAKMGDASAAREPMCPLPSAANAS